MDCRDPLAGSAWSRPDTVAGFTTSPPNATLMGFAGDELRRRPGARAIDLGCGAGRNAVPLAGAGWDVIGIDLSLPMLQAAVRRARDAGLQGRFHVALAPMDRIPARDRSCDLVVAHGIWNLARSATEFRLALREAARVACAGASLFVFTFSRSTLPAAAEPVGGEPFVFSQFSGQPQCFLTEAELVSELAVVGFAPDPGVPLRELNRPPPGTLTPGGGPLIYQGAFRYHPISS